MTDFHYRQHFLEKKNTFSKIKEQFFLCCSYFSCTCTLLISHQDNFRWHFNGSRQRHGLYASQPLQPQLPRALAFYHRLPTTVSQRLTCRCVNSMVLSLYFYSSCTVVRCTDFVAVVFWFLWFTVNQGLFHFFLQQLLLHLGFAWGHGENRRTKSKRDKAVWLPQ